MKFDMSLSDNFASFLDEKNGKHVFVDSFDNETFDVRIGSLEDSEPVGSVTAASDEELNAKLLELYEKHIGGA